MNKLKRKEADRPRAFWGALISAGVGIASALLNSSAQRKQRQLQASLEDYNNSLKEAQSMTNALNAGQDYQQNYLQQFKQQARLGTTRRLGSRNIMITDGGNAKKIGNNTYLLRGGSHEDINETGQTGIGINVGGNEIEAEGGEVAQRKGNSLRIYSAQPILGGISPAQAIMRGYNKDKVFNAQQRFKKNNGIKDDGSQQRIGGEVPYNPYDPTGLFGGSPHPLAKIIDITGITSYGDVKKLIDKKRRGEIPTTQEYLGALSAIPAIGRIAKGLNLIGNIADATSFMKDVRESEAKENAYQNEIVKYRDIHGKIKTGRRGSMPYDAHELRKRYGGLTSKDRGSSKHPYPSVSSKDFAGGGRSYPIPTKADAIDALRLAGLHGRSDVRSKVYSKYPSLRKKSLLGSCSRPVKGMRAKFAIGGKENEGYDMTGELSPVITTARYRTPSFTTVDTTARAIPNFGTIKVPSYVPTSTVPYIPQRHNRSRTIFSGGDYLGLGIDTLAALSTGLVNYNTAGKYVLPDRAPIIQASKLPTIYNVNPEIEEVKRYRDRLTGQTFNNTSSSVAALNRSSAINLDALSNLSKLWATKENEENKMLTEDAKNQQTVAAQNVQNELARQSEIARIKNEANQAKGDALNVGLSGLSQAWTNFWTAGRTAYEDDQSRRAMIASSKEATPTRLSEMDFDLSPDILASLYRTSKDDRTKRFYLSRLSPKQRLKYGIN